MARVGRSFGMRIVALASPGSRRSAAKLGVDALHPNDAMHEMLAEPTPSSSASPTRRRPTESSTPPRCGRSSRAPWWSTWRGAESWTNRRFSRRFATDASRSPASTCSRMSRSRPTARLGPGQRHRQPPLLGERREREPEDHRHLPPQPPLLSGRAPRRHAQHLPERADVLAERSGGAFRVHLFDGMSDRLGGLCKPACGFRFPHACAHISTASLSERRGSPLRGMNSWAM